MFLILLLIGLNVIVHWPWFFGLSILTSGDWSFLHSETQREYFTLPYIWNHAGFGNIKLQFSTYPILFLWGYFSNLGFAISERILYLYPIVLIAPISIYLLLSSIVKSRIAIFGGAVVYCFNTYFLLIQNSHLGIAAAFSLYPLVFWSSHRILERKKPLDILILTAVLVLISIYEFRILYLTVATLFIYLFIHFLFIANNKINFTNIKPYLLFSIPVLLVILANLYWLLALISTNSIASNAVFDRRLFGNEFLNILNSITLFHPFWTGSMPAIFEVQEIPLYFWIIPFLAIGGLIIGVHNKKVLFFILLTLVGIFLTKQVGEPFTEIYPFLYKNFPGFNAFREASKFFLLISFGYAVLISLFINYVVRLDNSKKIVKSIGLILSALVILIFLYNTKPLFTQELGGLYVERSIPNDYIKFKTFVLSQDEFFRTLWIPSSSRWSVHTENHPILRGVDIFDNNYLDFLVTLDDKRTTGEMIMDTLKSEHADNLLDLSSVKYVVVPIVDLKNDGNTFIQYGGNTKEYYENILSSLPYLEEIDIGAQSLSVYENKNFKPKLYITTEKERVDKKIPFHKVRYKRISPVEYKVEIDNLESVSYMNFTESFHSGWKLRLGDVAWYGVLLREEYFMVDEHHLINPANLNAFIIDPDKICSSTNSCIRNEDGTVDIRITLYFSPQSKVYLGVITSILSLILVFALLIFWIVIIHRKNEINI